LAVGNLIELMELYTTEFNKEKIEIGLVGYPNVGKSSVINAVFGKKKVAVASLPGKTKHFQTLPLSPKVTLCDCPGLVFPRISSSYAEMVLNGLISIDTLKAFE
jgi:large subunit GTPase 1